jgi:membrane-bound serine protease (ClpP class)
MAPATTLGAATPVAIGLPGADRRPAGDDAGARPGGKADPGAAPASSPALGPADAMTAKQVHDASAFIRGLAQQRGRNAAWAERAVREAVSLTAGEALRENVIDVVAADLPDLLAQIDGRTVRVHAGEVKLATRGLAFELVPPDWRQRLLSVIANPSFALVLMMIGIYGLMFEFASPGFGLPGTVGAICLLLALFALQVMPINYVGLALMILGIVLMISEAFIPSFGALGVGGIIAFVIGSVMLIDTDVPGYGIPWMLIVPVAAASGLFSFFVVGMAIKARTRPVVTGAEEMIGASGEILEDMEHEGWARIHSEQWQVRSSVPLKRGSRVRVRARHGLLLDVEPNNDDS